MQQKTDLLGFFIKHKIAANLLMFAMILGGFFGLYKLNIRQFPPFDLDNVQVKVVWSGASAEDVESAITLPLEQTLRSVDNLRKFTSTSTQGLSSISLELKEGTDIVTAINQIKQKVDEFRNLPTDAKEPSVVNLVRYEQVARLLIYGTDSLAELRILANSYEQQLLNSGIDNIDILGLPEQEISIQISQDTLQHLGLSLDQIGDRIGAFSQDLPAGIFGENNSATQLRSMDQRRDEKGFFDIPIISDATTRINLGDIAVIKRQNKKGGVVLTVDGMPAVEIILRNTKHSDSFKAAENFHTWLAQAKSSLPQGIVLHVYDEIWLLIKDRIQLLLKNGGTGLLLVVGVLYLFLSPRVALWVAFGIPVSFMATLLIMYFVGASINMISLFALIMALGIIVDDAIVVSEDALTRYQAGDAPLLAVEAGARRMVSLIIASSLTTIAAFIPLMLVGGPIGKILIAIPVVITAVILASIVESFFILPKHLSNSFTKMQHSKKIGWHYKFDKYFANWKNTQFKKLITLALKYRAVALSLVLTLLIVTAGLIVSQRLKFQFFPSAESSLIYASAVFVPGTPKAIVNRFLLELEKTLMETDRMLSAQSLILAHFSKHGSTVSRQDTTGHLGDNAGSVTVELQPSDRRSVRNDEFISAWKSRIQIPASLNELTIVSRIAGPPSNELSISFTGNTAGQLKQAATEFIDFIKQIPGVGNSKDNMPYGRQQFIYKLNDRGKSLGLTIAELGQQLRTAFDGKLIQIFQDGADEVEVRVSLLENEIDKLSTLHNLEIYLSSGLIVPLNSISEWSVIRGFETLYHSAGQLSIEVSATVNPKINNANLILQDLNKTLLPSLAKKYRVKYSLEGHSADQAETLSDMRYGLLIGLILIYLILAFTFSSYSWPLIIMAAIPFGLIGAVWGHVFLGIDLTILSLFGLFGLSGIVINDSIILVSFYQKLISQGIATQPALIEATCQRLRSVMLTSLTTIAGLTPLLFETSLQAQFLIPMAVSITFGLTFSTLLVLIIIPVLLSYHEDMYLWGRKLWNL